MNELNWIVLVVLPAMTFPLAFWIARVCLAGVFGMMESESRRRKGESLATGKLQPERTP